MALLGPAMAQEDGDASEGEGAPPEVASPDNGFTGGEPAGPNAGLDPGLDPNEDRFGDAGGGVELLQLGADLANAGFEVPLTAFEIFPESVRSDIQDLVGQLLPLLEVGKEDELTEFFDNEGSRIATVFDQLGLQPNAESLLDGPNNPSSSIKFPNEFEDYEAYLDSLELQPFEREYMLESHRIAEAYETGITNALDDQAKLQTALEDYQEELESLNERYAEQFREQYLESIERAGLDGRRPDIDR